MPARASAEIAVRTLPVDSLGIGAAPRSGFDVCATPVGTLCHAARHGNRRRRAQRLVDDAVALRELHQGSALLLGEVAVDVEGEADVAEADRRILGYAQRAAEVEIS